MTQLLIYLSTPSLTSLTLSSLALMTDQQLCGAVRRQQVLGEPSLRLELVHDWL